MKFKLLSQYNKKLKIGLKVVPLLKTAGSYQSSSTRSNMLDFIKRAFPEIYDTFKREKYLVVRQFGGTTNNNIKITTSLENIILNFNLTDLIIYDKNVKELINSFEILKHKFSKYAMLLNKISLDEIILNKKSYKTLHNIYLGIIDLHLFFDFDKELCNEYKLILDKFDIPY